MLSRMDPLAVDVWTDVACPWCWLGHRRLALALADEPDGSVVVRPRAFELRPGAPAESPAAPEAIELSLARVAAEGERSGTTLRFDLVGPVTNTRLAHQLVALAHHEGFGPRALEALFEGHFALGADVGDAEEAVGLVVAAVPELSAAGLLAALEAGAGEREVGEDEAIAVRLGITGVPFFLAGRAVALSGAHEPGALRELVRAARERVTTA
jgi:predicted DsbA family dithiol-disulfide isomerase